MVDEVGRLDPSQSVAVLIGVTEYPGTNFPPVPAARENVRRLAAELADEKVWGLSGPMRLVELIDPNRATVLRTVADAGRLVGRQGMLLVYFAGHAEPAGGELCLAMRDADRSNPRATMVPVAELVTAAGGQRSDKRMLVFDCCFSGRAASALPGTAVKVGETAGWYFVGAADGSTEASAPADSALTLFTTALAQALGGVPDGPEWLTPADVWKATAALLPGEHPPVHNDLAWAHRQPWVRNRRHVPRPRTPVPPSTASTAAAASGDEDQIPRAPALYAEPRYLASHPFVGRTAQLETLDDWAGAAQPHPVLLFEAIGGNGKSMLTWEWVTRHAATARPDWAGRFWYSFYEKGAVMADFCRRALAYMTGRPLSDFRDQKQGVLTEHLLRELRAKPWLLVLDGLERVLVAYHRLDASQLADEHAGKSDEIATRDPRSAIRPADDELLRWLADAAPSKILMTSRLTPRVLLNSAGQAIPGALVERLPGLRPVEAEAMLRACGVHGDARLMREFLQRHCDCHPLVTGVVAGLVNSYLPARGDFDRWATDSDSGRRLDLGDLDLVQKRNHILSTALQALPQPGGQLLAALSLLPDAVDFRALQALNPHLPPPVEVVERPYDPEELWDWGDASEEDRAASRLEYQRSMRLWQEYQKRRAEWESSVAAAVESLSETVDDLERRGLLQYDRQARRWDLHPVVRATARNRLTGADRDRFGQQIIDHFSQQSPAAYESVASIDELHDALIVIRTMIAIGRVDDAAELLNDLADILLHDLEAYPEIAALARPMFTADWSALVVELRTPQFVITNVNFALSVLGLTEAYENLCRLSIESYLDEENWRELRTCAQNIVIGFMNSNKLALAYRVQCMASELGELVSWPGHGLSSMAHHMAVLGLLGRWSEAEQRWQRIKDMDRNVPRRSLRSGDPEREYLDFVAFPCGRLTEENLTEAERLAEAGRNRRAIRQLRRLRGIWRLRCGRPAAAVEPLQDAVRMAHEAGFADDSAVAYLALARLECDPDDHSAIRGLALRLSNLPVPPCRPLAELWRALGDTGQAIDHARAAYTWAWADGEPYVRRHALDEAAALLRALGAPLPELPPYDPARYPLEDWERDLAHAIARLKDQRNAD
ncbi:hypothetical protein AB0F81_39185 [Actinoplanes sp. NPDC024001]|uniref:caspase family protein n=1 Tax=Actinoplanes sp. NPDC024001 TaxID=3154598 RepID=UPI0033C16E98